MTRWYSFLSNWCLSTCYRMTQLKRWRLPSAHRGNTLESWLWLPINPEPHPYTLLAAVYVQVRSHAFSSLPAIVE